MLHPLHIVALRQVCDDFLEIRGALRNCTGTEVWPIKSSSSAVSMSSVFHSKFLDHAMHFTELPHDVLQHRVFLLDVVVRQCLPVFELLSLLRSIAAGRDECLPCLGSLPSHCLAGQRLDEDLHCTTQCVLLGFGGDGLRRLREGLPPSASCVRNTFRLLARLLVIPSPPCSSC